MSSKLVFKMNECFGCLSKSEIDNYIKRSKVLLPQDYVSFLMDTNGGRPANQFFQHVDFGISLITHYYGLNFGEYDYRDLERATESVRRISDIFNEVIRIATDPGGLAICMGVTESNLGIIFLFDHDSAETEIKLLKIADSFQVFFNSFYETPEEAELVYEYQKSNI